MSNSDIPADINKLDSSLISSNRLLLDRYLGINTSDLTFGEIDLFRPEVYKRLSDNSKNLVFIKTHDIWQTNDNGKPIFPDDVTKGVLYFIRNPLDIVVSFAHHADLSVSKSISILNKSDYGLCNMQNKLYNQIHQALSDWSHHVISWTKSSGLPIHIVRYEDLLNHTLREFINCLNFTGLEYDPLNVAKAVSNSSFETLQQQESKFGFREKELVAKSFFRKGIADDWKSHLSQANVNEIYRYHETTMREFGYLEEIIGDR